MKSKLPTSRAKTAYGLLSEIAQIALDEPKRIRMGITLDRREEYSDGEYDQDYFPRCGTVGCIAGWTRVLRSESFDTGFGGTLEGSRRTLGLTDSQADELFLDSALCAAPRQQTPAHAKAVARHITKFQKKYRSQLLAKKVR